MTTNNNANFHIENMRVGEMSNRQKYSKVKKKPYKVSLDFVLCIRFYFERDEFYFSYFNPFFYLKK